MPTLSEFSRATVQQTVNVARFFKPYRVITLLTVFFLSWVFWRWVMRPPFLQSLPQNIVEFLDLYEFGSTITLILVWGILIFRRWAKPANRQATKPAITVADLYALSPYEFEAYVAKLFERKGYQVMQRGGSGDKGVDLVVEQGTFGKRAIVQCKRYRNRVGPDTVRELYGTLLHERASHGFLVTTADISASAREWAKNKSLTLIDGKTLVKIANSLHR